MSADVEDLCSNIENKINTIYDFKSVKHLIILYFHDNVFKRN